MEGVKLGNNQQHYLMGMFSIQNPILERFIFTWILNKMSLILSQRIKQAKKNNLLCICLHTENIFNVFVLAWNNYVIMLIM